MNILLTNDDGYYAEGIVLLKKLLKKYGTVYTVAPRNAMSGKSTAITIGDLFTHEKLDKYNYIVDGTPADCVSFGLKTIKEKIDVVFSGCNKGLNISIFIHYSGTVGACNQALIKNVPAVAFSASDYNLDKLPIYFDRIMNFILKNKLIKKGQTINVNLPFDKEIKGIRVGKFDLNNGKIYFCQNDGRLYVNEKLSKNFKDKDGDLYLASNGYISIVPINISPFNIEEFKNLQSKIKGEI